MKLGLIIIIFIGILTQTFNKVAIFSVYLLNKEFITAKYCENKNKPKMHCNGKCHLNKQLKEQDKHENSAKNNSKDEQETQLFCQSFINMNAFLNWINCNSNLNYLEKKSDPELSSVFRPPTC